MKQYLSIAVFAFLFITYSSAQTKITFSVDQLPDDKLENIGLRGSIPPLSWEKSIPLEKGKDGFFTTVTFQETGNELEFKFVQFDNDKKPTWESIQNRTFQIEPNSNLVSKNKWDKDQVVDIKKLRLLTSEELMADFELIKTMVLDVHPGTFRYNDEAGINAELDELKTKFSQPLTYGQAYIAMSKLAAAIKCDHTHVGPYNQGKIINSIIHFQKDKVPFTFKWLDKKMVVLRNASENDQLTKGTIINKINGVPIEDIFDKMIQYMPADGATDGNRIFKMEVSGYDFRYSGFDVGFPLLFPFEKEELALEVEPFGKSSVELLSVTTLTREERSKILEERYSDFPRTRDELWDFEILKDKVGLLTINSFGLYGFKAMTLDYKKYLTEVFQKIKKEGVEHLIVDIRENMGGADEMAAELFTYFPNSNEKLEREGRMRYINFPESLKPHIKTWGPDPWYFNPKPDIVKPTDGYYIFPNNFNQKSRKGKASRFKGNVYLLTSGANTSLAFYTALTFKKQKLGLTVGQETGGNLNDINGGQILFLTLPNSGIEIDVPVMGGFTVPSQPNQGVKPDIETEYTLEDIIEERDLELEAVLKVIAKS